MKQLTGNYNGNSHQRRIARRRELKWNFAKLFTDKHEQDVDSSFKFKK